MSAAPDPSSSAAAPQSFDDIYRAYAMTVASWAARLGKPWLEPEDVTHDVFLKVQRSLASAEVVLDVEAWLYSITVNVIRSRRRVEQFRRWFQRPEADGARVAARGLSAVEAIERREAQHHVLRALETLSDRDREVLVLFELEGRSGNEVARLLGVPVQRIWVRLHRARSRFADAVEHLRGGER